MELTLQYVPLLRSPRAFTDVFSLTIRSHPPRMRELPEFSRWQRDDSAWESQAPSRKPYTYKVAGAGLQPRLLGLWGGDHLSTSAFLSLDLTPPLRAAEAETVIEPRPCGCLLLGVGKLRLLHKTLFEDSSLDSCVKGSHVQAMRNTPSPHRNNLAQPTRKTQSCQDPANLVNSGP